jgi:hypothetical protein
LGAAGHLSERQEEVPGFNPEGDALEKKFFLTD